MRIHLRPNAIISAVALLIAITACADSSAPSRRADAHSPDSVTTARRTVTASLDASRFLELQRDPASAWQVEGLVLTRSKVFIHDAIRDSILVFELDSAFRRATSAERLINAAYKPRTLLFPASDTTFVLLDRNANIAHLMSDSGHKISAWRWLSPSEPSAVCIANDSTAFVFAHGAAHYQMLLIRQNARVSRQSVAPEPWPNYYNRHWLVGHVVAGGVTTAGECVFGHLFQLGVAFVPTSGNALTTPYIERLSVPHVRIDTSTANGVSHKSESFERAERGARSIAATGDSVLVLFEGNQTGASTRIDVYDATSRSYRHTISLGERVDAVAASTRSVALLVRKNGRVGVLITTIRSAPVRN